MNTKLMTYVISDASGQPLRIVSCCTEDVGLQARSAGDTIRPATPEDVQACRDRFQAIIAAAQAHRVDPPSPLEVLVEALRAKGMDLSKADLAAATATLQARRKDPAQGRK